MCQYFNSKFNPISAIRNLIILAEAVLGSLLVWCEEIYERLAVSLKIELLPNLNCFNQPATSSITSDSRSTLELICLAHYSFWRRKSRNDFFVRGDSLLFLMRSVL